MHVLVMTAGSRMSPEQPAAFSRRTPQRALRLVTVALLIVLLSLPQAHAATWYVATDGSDSTGDGSQGAPWASITHAVDNSSDGDLVLVKPGTYHGRQQLRQQFDTAITVRSSVPMPRNCATTAARR